MWLSDIRSIFNLVSLKIGNHPCNNVSHFSKFIYLRKSLILFCVKQRNIFVSGRGISEPLCWSVNEE